MVKKIDTFFDLPVLPAVYIMYGGRGRGTYVAYVGITKVLRNRVIEHLVKRDRSVATGTTAVVLKPEYITAVKWWEYPSFAEKEYRQAAELVAFDIFKPSLKSRARVKTESKKIYEDVKFRDEMLSLFEGDPSGHLTILTLQDALAKIRDLEMRLDKLEKKLS